MDRGEQKSKCPLRTGETRERQFLLLLGFWQRTRFKILPIRALLVRTKASLNHACKLCASVFTQVIAKGTNLLKFTLRKTVASRGSFGTYRDVVYCTLLYAYQTTIRVGARSHSLCTREMDHVQLAQKQRKFVLKSVLCQVCKSQRRSGA